MSLKFTAMGRLPILSAIETRARAKDQARENLGVASRSGRPRRRQLRHICSWNSLPDLPSSQRR